MRSSRLEGRADEAGLPPMPETVALAADRDRCGAMEQPVQKRGRERRVGEDLIPLPEVLVACEDDRLLQLVALVHELEQAGGVVPLEWLIADLVEDQECGAEQHLHEHPEPIAVARGPGLGDEIMEREEVDAVPARKRGQGKACR